ncbi:hypothetical protein BJY04DRAFT_216690 [Aspergillus karnatakaensis]|uniref:uncharacterized protein n=1 Tax=Aspergillus karnatakaensis TaxID=1810916 RepID=UPI003CCD5970
MESNAVPPRQSTPRVEFVAKLMRSASNLIPTRRLSDLSVTKLVRASGRWLSSSTLVSDLAPVNGSKQDRESKRAILREIFRKWLQSQSERDGSDGKNETIGSTTFVALIKDVLRENHTQPISVGKICKEIARRNEWCRNHQRDGWEETVAWELEHNPAFKPVIECREGRIRKIKSVKWRLSSTVPYMQRSSLSLARYPSARQVDVPVSIIEEAADTTTLRSLDTCSPSATRVSPGFPVPVLRRSRRFSPPTNSLYSLGDITCPSESITKPVNLSPIVETASEGSQKSAANESDSAGHGSGHMVHSIGNTLWAASPTSHPQGSGSPGEDRPMDTGGNGDGNESNSALLGQDKKGPRFPCVYHKWDPQRYGLSERKYRTCPGPGPPGFEFISGVVRHLERTHKQFTCRKCYHYYHSENECGAHMAQCRVEPPQSQEAKWATLWHARFPNVPVPQDIGLTSRQTTSLLPIASHSPTPPGPSPETLYQSHLLPSSRGTSITPSSFAPNVHTDEQGLSLSTTLESLLARVSSLEQRVATLERPFIPSPDPMQTTALDGFGDSILNTAYGNDLFPGATNQPTSLFVPSTATPSTCSLSELSIDNQPPTANTSYLFNGDEIFGSNLGPGDRVYGDGQSIFGDIDLEARASDSLPSFLFTTPSG